MAFAGGQASKKRKRQHRGDPAADGWDTTILKAPDAHKADAREQHRHERHRSAAGMVLQGVGIAILVVIGIGLAVALGLFIALVYTGTIQL